MTEVCANENINLFGILCNFLIAFIWFILSVDIDTDGYIWYDKRFGFQIFYRKKNYIQFRDGYIAGRLYQNIERLPRRLPNFHLVNNLFTVCHCFTSVSQNGIAIQLNIYCRYCRCTGCIFLLSTTSIFNPFNWMERNRNEFYI